MSCNSDEGWASLRLSASWIPRNLWLELRSSKILWVYNLNTIGYLSVPCPEFDGVDRVPVIRIPFQHAITNGVVHHPKRPHPITTPTSQNWPCPDGRIMTWADVCWRMRKLRHRSTESNNMFFPVFVFIATQKINVVQYDLVVYTSVVFEVETQIDRSKQCVFVFITTQKSMWSNMI